ncbi:hypothetical protein [Ancylobacter defluvii]|uniref:Uncharacterized protein n=1 Tax=Ancylobacter defluvii TaxID=1282440 RepID=A0A9W6JYD5_9HYPH|nr:hypothetical protein [Ancylobacter defluvii]MBS7586840.1 hypothetical protein [Ancylobacter defluvii]GLK86146.1 hypothetical protein GCM10017653_42160 [Ancylobacter defluvii]
MSNADHAFDSPAVISAVRVRAGSAEFDITTLDEALAFAQANPHAKGDYDGLIRRLQSAVDPDDVTEAGNAFRWWAESNGIAVEPRR